MVTSVSKVILEELMRPPNCNSAFSRYKMQQISRLEGLAIEKEVMKSNKRHLEGKGEEGLLS